jgi:YidC/Oxa1 family membrane protein insertase
MMEQKNVVLAIVLSAIILIGSQFIIQRYFPAPHPVPTQTTETNANQATTGAGTTPQPAAPAVAAEKPRAEVIAETPRVAIRTDSVIGTISLVGGRLDDLTLAKYRETVDPNSPQIVLLSPPGAKDAYYADFGWLPESGGTIKVPDLNTRWSADSQTLTADHPVTLSWDNGQGMTFTRTFSIDQNYMFTVTDSVKNGAGAAVKLHPYGRIRRVGTPKIVGYYILHEGLLGVLDGSLRETKYSSLKPGEPELFNSTGGWLGITDKYWLVALAPNQSDGVSAQFRREIESGTDVYYTDFRDANPLTLAPGGNVSTTTHLFAGAKVVRILSQYRDQLGIPKFELAVDFGWFWFLTEPLFWVLDHLNNLIGNFGLAILALTIIVRLLMFPLANKSFRAMNKMKKLTPLMTELRERYKDDKQRLNQEMMELYKREKVNPAAGCLPVLVQIPVFFCLYKTLFVTIEMRHAPFFGWIKDLSAPDPTTWINLFGLLPWGVPHDLSYLGPLGGIVGSVVSLGVWPIIMGVTMWLQQKLNPAPPDPVQARIFMFLPIVFTFTLARFPAGLVIYWAWNNLLSISQQKFLMWKMGQKP